MKPRGDAVFPLHIKSIRERNLTSEEFREFFKYDPDTGHFFRIKTAKGAECNKRVGFITPSDGYRRIRVKGLNFMEHRLAFLYMTSKWPQFIVDHINGIRDDNRWCNLRHVTWSQNNAVRSTQNNNSSGIRGVCLHRSGRWRAALWFNGRQIYHKLFATKEEAAVAYATAFEKYYGFPMNEAPSVLIN